MKNTFFLAALFGIHFICQLHWQVINVASLTSSIYIGPSLLITQFAAIAAAVSLTALVAARIKPAPGDAR